MNKIPEGQTATLASASWRDYYELCKPRVVMLMILTSLIGMFLAVPGMVPLDVLIIGNLGIALCAGSAAAVNHLVDRHIDKKMARTFNRPIAKGRVTKLPRRTNFQHNNSTRTVTTMAPSRWVT